MSKYEIGEVWWTDFPYEETETSKHRPAIVINDEEIAILTVMITSKRKDDPLCIQIDDWQEAGLKVPSGVRIDRIIQMEEWRMLRRMGRLSERDFTKVAQLVVDYVSDITHAFSLVAIMNQQNQLLQVYDERWKCWLFPYFRTTEENNKKNIDDCISNALHMSITTLYVTKAKHCKFSESDQVYKVYDHTLYRVELTNMPDYMKNDFFELDGKKYQWMTIRDMERDADIMEKNDDIVAFVKTKCL